MIDSTVRGCDLGSDFESASPRMRRATASHVCSRTTVARADWPNRVLSPGRFRGCNDLLRGGIRLSISDVSPDRRAEQDRILEHIETRSGRGARTSRPSFQLRTNIMPNIPIMV